MSGAKNQVHPLDDRFVLSLLLADYVSHVPKFVDDPEALCSGLSRLTPTPGQEHVLAEFVPLMQRAVRAAAVYASAVKALVEFRDHALATYGADGVPQ